MHNSFTALMYCTNQLVKNGSVLQVRKTNFNIFKRTFIANMILSLTSIVFITGLVIYLTMDGSNIIYIPMASLSLLALIFISYVAVHLFPAFTEEENSNKAVKELFKESVSLGFAKMKKHWSL